MKPQTYNTKLFINIVLTLFVLWIIFVPGLLPILMGYGGDFMGHAARSLRMFGPVVGLFLLNYIFLCPKCLFVKGKRKWFYIVNIVLIAAWRAWSINKALSFTPPPMGGFPHEMPDTDFLSHFKIAFIYQSLLRVLLNICVICLAVGLSYIIRSIDINHQYEVQKRNAAEAELSWLKNQLNPHFLFNTLNNISSLTVIDGDKAQESIAQLSDLLRYVLYETDKDMVPLSGEVEFMKDYIDLMKLRCNGKASVNVTMVIPSGNAQIAPLLFISLIENAFKHGVNSRMDSFLDVSMRADGADLVFECSNSMFEKQKTDMAGSGIGIQNMHKRLELIYPGRYEFNYGPQEDRYCSTLRIRNIFA